MQKLILLVIHLAALAVFVAGVSMIYCNANFKKGLQWMNSVSYEESPAFNTLLAEETAEILNYVRYRDVFETGGEMDYDNEVFAYSTGAGDEEIWTINNVLEYAEQHGYYFDNDFNVQQDASALQGDGMTYPVTWRAYRSQEKLAGPGSAFVTLDHMTREVMTILGDYRRSEQRYNSGNSNLFYNIELEGRRTYTNRPGLTEDVAKSFGKYVILDSGRPEPDNNLSETPDMLRSLLRNESRDPSAGYRMILAVDTTYPYQDAFYAGLQDYGRQRRTYAVGLVLAMAGAPILLLTLFLLLRLAGHTENDTAEITLTRYDRRMPEANILSAGAACIVLVFLADKTAARLMHMVTPEQFWVFGEKMITDVVIYLCFLPLLFSLTRAMKAGILWENSFLKRLQVMAAEFSRNITFSRRFFIYYSAFVFLNIALIVIFAWLLFCRNSLLSRLIMFVPLVILALLDMWFFQKLYKKQEELDKLAVAIRGLGTSAGAEILDLADFEGREAEIAGLINHVNEGLQAALETQVRSERMKAELITNVSHDIKTPLTSIINYVDLMKRAKPEDPVLLSYLEILDKKSQHLKTLTEDLVEASKASTGNIQINFADIDFVELAEQSNGEFEERFLERNLTLVGTFPKEQILIHADGQHLWRVLENLYNNAFKYAMENSRVYVGFEKHDGKVRFTMKNISANPLNISPEELTERFVRGDVSRTTEGSGLGLSIARSLTELQGGEFKIEIDGDYYKASLTFDIVASS
ncbi:MAG: HAMP domain-containing histidine kinase [Stomatobaculum sp.]|nr:HAMP domain-containing histidine kinase [Stomatobaculum sp.]